MKDKKGGILIWIFIIIFIIITIAVIIYFKFFYNVVSLSIEDFPKQIESYSMVGNNGPGTGYKCLDSNPIAKNGICLYYLKLEYLDSYKNKGIFLNIMRISKGKKDYEKYFSSNTGDTEINQYYVFKIEESELSWYNEEGYYIVTQDFTKIIEPNGDTRYEYNKATGKDAVTKYYIDKYNPIKNNN